MNCNRQTTDVFCLQEASDIGETLIDKHLPNFNKITAYKYITEPDTFHLATYFNKSITLFETKILNKNNPLLAPGIYIKFELNNNPVHIINFHGFSRPVDKLDSDERLRSIQELVNFSKNLKGLIIIGGDFNLLPDTTSIKLLEQARYANLIKQFGIKSTRNKVVWKRYPNTKQYFSDYVFVNKTVKIKSFEVVYTEISDHLPMTLNF